jgi:hypothetical protein
MLLSLSCFKLVCHLFPTLRVLYVFILAIFFCILLLCSATQKIKRSLMKTSFSHATSGHLSVAWYLFPLFRPFWSCNMFYKTCCIINIGCTVYFTIYYFMCET